MSCIMVCKCVLDVCCSVRCEVVSGNGEVVGWGGFVDWVCFKGE